jgi:hypothetical protein
MVVLNVFNTWRLLCLLPIPSSASKGVGKTELAKALAGHLFNAEDAMVGSSVPAWR